MRQEVATGGARNARERLHPVALVRKGSRRHIPVRELPIDRPAERDAAQGEHVVHQLASGAAFGVGEGHHRCIGRGEHGVVPTPGDSDAGLPEAALPADVLGEYAELGAVDQSPQFHRAGGGFDQSLRTCR